ncbi:alpha-hydroxy acid oxidase [Derxia gummosa]|uniref:Alpha-hydroxy acid oxidase n=1 Tax=Derxia gummosa DSM 723 TaxID=1121388 RepID=A0A8B6XCF6_9BURK|nr:alpha-hydroxy acid oxidase [Derxia gummosa]
MLERKLPLRRRVADAINIDELERMARARVPAFAHEYLAGGAEDELTLAANRAAFAHRRFLPPMLRPAPARRLGATLFGRPLALPLAIAPTGFNGLQARDGDCALARAAASAGVPFTLSTVANASIEQIAAAAPEGRRWFQLYPLRDRAITLDLLARARRSGFEALVLTADAVHYGNREWDRRSYRGALRLRWGRLLDVARHPRWVRAVMGQGGLPGFANLAPYLPAGQGSVARTVAFIDGQMDRALDWAFLDWLRAHWDGPLLLKGVLRADDALQAFAHGADGVIVSNHGGRQLDGAIASLDALAAIRAAVGPAATLLLDGGIRRGTDIAKALALGADAVLTGRATLFGLAAGGEAGARRALDLLGAEFDRTLALLGCTAPEELGLHLVVAAPEIHR